jgi:hypothetical protein
MSQVLNKKKGEEHFQVQLDGRFTKKKKREQISAREMIPRIFGRPNDSTYTMKV